LDEAIDELERFFLTGETITVAEAIDELASGHVSGETITVPVPVDEAIELASGHVSGENITLDDEAIPGAYVALVEACARPTKQARPTSRPGIMAGADWL